LNGIVLDVRLEPRAAARLQEFTKHHIGEYLAIFYNGELLGTPPRIIDPVSNPAIMLSGLPPTDAQRLAEAVAARRHSGP
jgi:preprotein translocase subunit SecD